MIRTAAGAALTRIQELLHAAAAGRHRSPFPLPRSRSAGRPTIARSRR